MESIKKHILILGIVLLGNSAVLASNDSCYNGQPTDAFCNYELIEDNCSDAENIDVSKILKWGKNLVDKLSNESIKLDEVSNAIEALQDQKNVCVRNKKSAASSYMRQMKRIFKDNISHEANIREINESLRAAIEAGMTTVAESVAQTLQDYVNKNSVESAIKQFGDNYSSAFREINKAC